MKLIELNVLEYYRHYMTVWYDCTVQLYGKTVWYDCMLWLFGIHNGTTVWYDFMVQLYGTTVWYNCMVWLYGMILWYNCMVTLWYNFMVRLMGWVDVWGGLSNYSISTFFCLVFQTWVLTWRNLFIMKCCFVLDCGRCRMI